jgi:hypothetical protein
MSIERAAHTLSLYIISYPWKSKLHPHWPKSKKIENAKPLPALSPIRHLIKISPPRLPNFLPFQLSTILIAYAQIPPDLNAVVDTSVAFFCISIAALMMKFYRFEMRPR